MYADIPAMYSYTVHTRTRTYKQINLAGIRYASRFGTCLIYLVYLIIPIPCISYCIANTISLEQVMSEDMVNYLLVQSILFSRYFTSREKSREDRIRVKVRQILFGINGDQWFSSQKPDQSKYLYLTLTLRQIFPTTFG